MTEAIEFDWMRWRDTPPDASTIPVEVVCDDWPHVRLWCPSSVPPDDVTPGLLWRPCGSEVLRMTREGGIYDAEGAALYGSPRLVVSPADPRGPWPSMFVLRSWNWPNCGPPGRLWLVPPSGELAEVPAVILGDLVAVTDGGEPVVMRGPTVDQLRGLAAQVVNMTGGFRA